MQARGVALTNCAGPATGHVAAAQAGAGGAARAPCTAVAGAWTGARVAWYGVAVLTLTQVVSYIDRFLPSLLVGPLKADLHLSDLQMGFLLGPAFGVLYVLMGLPIGWLADRVNRRALLATGVTVWCAMTAAASVVRSFVPLFATRLGVGLGEATVAPCAVSLISDYFPRATRSRALSVFMSGTFLGAGSAFLFGGPLVHRITALGAVTLGPLGELRAWQLAFLLIGTPGLVLAALLLTVREPARRERIAQGITLDSAGQVSLSGALRFIRQHWRAFGLLFVGSGCTVTLGSLVLWNVALFERTWGWSVRDVGIATGVAFFTGGPLGTALGMWLTNRWIARGRKDATARALLTGLALAIPGFALYPLMPSTSLAMAAIFLAFTGQAAAAAAGPACLASITPGQMRSQGMAIYYLVISIAGQLLGPLPVGWMTDLFADPAKLRYAMTIEALAVGVPGVLLARAALGSYRRHVEQLETLIDASAGGAVHA
jgi:MFS family permease